MKEGLPNSLQVRQGELLDGLQHLFLTLIPDLEGDVVLLNLTKEWDEVEEENHLCIKFFALCNHFQELFPECLHHPGLCKSWKQELEQDNHLEQWHDHDYNS